MDDKEFKFRLEKYSGRASRHECPKCHDKHSFVYYVDNEGVPIDESVGRCNHESNCGYHYKPREYYRDNSIEIKERPIFHFEKSKTKHRSISIAPPTFVSYKVLVNSLGTQSTFVDFLNRTIKDKQKVDLLCKAYQLGCNYKRNVIFWQIDYRMHIRTGKIMAYDLVTGKRDKTGKGINWVHAAWKGKKGIPDNFNLKQCLFGEHLLRLFPEAPVAVVESEKTAILAYSLFPEYVWVATGGKSQIALNKLSILKGRKVILFPDVDGYQEWVKLADQLKYCNVIVSDILETMASQKDREAKIDIGDIIIRYYQELP